MWTASTHARNKEEERQEASKQTGSWTGVEPWLCLHEAACSDEAREALLAKNACLDRWQLDAQNSEHKPKTCEEVVADLFDNPEFAPSSDSLPELHSDFSDSIDLPFANMPGPITPKQVKSKMADARCKLMKTINRWERSGNRFGQLREDKEEEEEVASALQETEGEDDDDCQGIDVMAEVNPNFGHLVVKKFLAGDNRQSFVWHHEGESSHQLCLWHKLDTQGVLSKVINKLDQSVAVDCDSELSDATETGSRDQKRKQEQAKEEQEFGVTIGGALSGLAHQAMVENRDRARRACNACRVNKLREADSNMKVEWENMETEACK